MEEAAFLALINQIGTDNVLGFVFDNADRVFYGQEETKYSCKASFSLKDYDTATKCIKIEHSSSTGIGPCPKYTVYKPIAVIQTVIARDPKIQKNAYDIRNLS